MRVADYIEHQVRRLAKALGKRAAWWVVGVLALLLLVTAAVYLRERAQVNAQSIDAPVSCEKLFFKSNTQRCDERIAAIYGTLPVLERRQLCEGERTGAASILCNEYDLALTIQQHNASLQEQGISLWQPHNATGGVFYAKSLQPIASITLICNGTILAANWSQSELIEVRYALQNTTTSCRLAARTAEGVITSGSFIIEGEKQ